MPNFPRYDSKAQLTTETPAVLKEPDLAQANKTAMMGKVAGEASQALFKWQDALKTIQNTHATAENKMATLDTIDRAEKDANYNNSQQYFDEIKQHQDKILQGISDPAARQDMATNFAYEYRVAEIQINHIYKNKLMDVGAEAVGNLLQTEYQNPTEHSLGNIQKLLDTQKASGLIKHEKYQKVMQEANAKLGVERVSKDLFNAQTPEEMDNVVSSLKSGAYEQGGVTISPQEKIKMLRSAEIRGRQIVTKQNFMGEIQRANNTHEAVDLANNGLLTGPILEEQFLTRGIANSTYKSLQDSANSAVGPTAGTDHKTYYDLTHYLLQKNANPDVAIQKILDANASGKLSRDDQKKLYEMHLTPSAEGHQSLQDMVNAKPQDQFDKMKMAYDAQIKDINDKRGWFKPAFDHFNENFTGPEKEKNVTESTQKLVDNIQTNKLKKEEYLPAAEKIVAAERLKQHPEWAKFPEKGQLMHDRYGNKVLVYPDGRIQKKE